MEELTVYAVFGVDEPPRKILCASGHKSKPIAIPAAARQMVLFTKGIWGKHTSISVELKDSKPSPILSGKLTPKIKCLCWEYWEDAIWSSGATLSLKLDGESMITSDQLVSNLTQTEFTPENTEAREAPWKRKRNSHESENEDVDQENKPPDSQASGVGFTPHRRGRKGQKGSQTRLFSKDEQPATQTSSPAAVPARNTVTPRSRGRPTKTVAPAEPLGCPSGRWGQSLCPIDAQTAILIGGQGSRMQFCKDPMWKLCTEDLSWMPAETLAEGPTPEARIGHTAVYDPESRRIFVFGGSKSKKWFNDMHILDTQSWHWSLVKAQGKVPPLAYHSCSLFRGELFVFGGVFPRPHPEPDGCSDSIYIFNPDMAIWYQPITNGDKPVPRSGHSACVMQGKIFIFGGWDTPVCFNDMHVLDLGLMEFSAVKTNGTPPSPRSWHGCGLLSESRFLVHGGYNGNNALSDSFIFNTETSSWTTVNHPKLTSAPRAGHSIITMSTAASEEQQDLEGASSRVFIFGGGDNEGSFFSDLLTITAEELED